MTNGLALSSSPSKGFLFLTSVFPSFVSCKERTRTGFSGCFLSSIFPISWLPTSSVLSPSRPSLLAFFSESRQISKDVGHSQYSHVQRVPRAQLMHNKAISMGKEHASITIGQQESVGVGRSQRPPERHCLNTGILCDDCCGLQCLVYSSPVSWALSYPSLVLVSAGLDSC